MSDLQEVLCPLCVRQGGLKMFMEFKVPVLSCCLPGCKLILVGEIQGGDAVFPDPHVKGGRG